MAILDDGASLKRTEVVGEVIKDQALKDPSVRILANINGIDITTVSVKSNYTTFFTTLKPWSQRKEKSQSAEAITQKMMAVTMMQPEAVVLGFMPPPISGMSTTGGFEGYIQMRGNGTI